MLRILFLHKLKYTASRINLKEYFFYGHTVIDKKCLSLCGILDLIVFATDKKYELNALATSTGLEVTVPSILRDIGLVVERDFTLTLLRRHKDTIWLQ